MTKRALKFTPQAMQRIAEQIGFKGDVRNKKELGKFFEENPDAGKLFSQYKKQAKQMVAASGGMVPVRKYQVGGLTPTIGADGVTYAAGDVPSSGNNFFGYGDYQTAINAINQSSSTPTTTTIQDAIAPLTPTTPTFTPPPTQQIAPLTTAPVSGTVPITTPQPTPVGGGLQEITQESLRRQLQPTLPTGAGVTPVAVQLTPEQLLAPTSGQVVGDVGADAAISGTTLATAAPVSPAAQLITQQAAPQVATAVADLQAAQVQAPTQITAAQQDASAVSGLQAAQGAATVLTNPVQRQIQTGELVSEAANAQTAATFTEQVQAATAQPSTQATVQGQFEQLFTSFDASNPPAWASGAVRTATQRMVQRGLGASRIAGQAIVQATLEAALPIAQADASILSQFELNNLSNRQQRAMLGAQQRAAFIGQEFDQRFQSRVQNSARIADIANQNFTAEQQIALENSRNAQTVNLANLSNRQAVTLAEASALANLDQSNLNNRQQAAVQNAQNFLQADLTNASAQQQTAIFKTQQQVQSLFTDQAAENAARQFNATSQNQVDQFFAQLQTQTAQFNTSQANAQAQFNAGQVNVVNRFNQELNNQRDQFNAKNRLVIDQSNATWRRQLSTAATAQLNRANEINAKALLDISNISYNNLWQHFSDLIEFAVDSAENELDRTAQLAIAEIESETRAKISAEGAKSSAGRAVGSLIGTLGSALIMRA